MLTGKLLDGYGVAVLLTELMGELKVETLIEAWLIYYVNYANEDGYVSLAYNAQDRVVLVPYVMVNGEKPDGTFVFGSISWFLKSLTQVYIHADVAE